MSKTAKIKNLMQIFLHKQIHRIRILRYPTSKLVEYKSSLPKVLITVVVESSVIVVDSKNIIEIKPNKEKTIKYFSLN